MIAPVLRSEWIKLRTSRATYVSLAAALALGLGIGLLDVLSVAGHWATMSAADRASFDPVGDPLSGFQFGELAFGALGVLAASTEYATGMIRSTLTATPQRGRVYTAKALTLGLLAVAATQLCAFTAFFAGQLVLRRQHLQVSVTDPHVARAVAGVGVYMTVVTLVGFGLGAFLRHTAGAMSAMFALVFLAYPAARTFEASSYLPDHLILINAATAIGSTTLATGPHAGRVPSLNMAWLDLVLYVVVFLGIGAWRALRDAN
jgi:ABC-2 type transport system permease protein